MPLMGSRGGGSVRGFGRFGKNLLLALIDTFDRTTVTSLGTSSDGKGLWKNIIGTWAGNSSVAVSLAAAAGNNVTVVDMDGANITNLQVDLGNAGGVGVSFWVTDSNSYYALYPTYNTSTTSNTVCGAGGISTSSSNSCGTYYSGQDYYKCVGCQCGEITLGACQTAQEACIGLCGNPLTSYVNWCGQSTCYYINATVTTTNYNSVANLKKVEGGSATALVTSQYATSTSSNAYSYAQSVAISTSGNTTSYSLYSSTGKGGSTLASGTNTPSTPVKGIGVGLFQTTSATIQGSSFDNFSVEVTP
jgi:hypothetical protein